MNYIQIDNFNGSINIVCKDDGSGEPLIFNSLEEAVKSLEENCQDGIVVPLMHSLQLLLRIKGLFNSGNLLFEEEPNEDRINFMQIKMDLDEIV